GGDAGAAAAVGLQGRAGRVRPGWHPRVRSARVDRPGVVRWATLVSNRGRPPAGLLDYIIWLQRCALRLQGTSLRALAQRAEVIIRSGSLRRARAPARATALSDWLSSLVPGRPFPPPSRPPPPVSP